MVSENIYVKSNGVNLNTIVKGENENADILITLHGGPGTGAKSLMSKKGITLLEKDFLVVYFDQRGCDKSEYNLREGLELDDLLEDINAVVDFVKSKYSDRKVYLFGGSFGAFLGFMYIEKYPNKVEKFIASSPALSFEALLTKEYIFKLMDRYKNKIPKPLMATLKVLPLNKKAILKLINTEKIEELVWSRKNNPKNFVHLYAMKKWIFEKDVRPLFSTYNIPILVLQGTEDDECKFEIVDEAIKNASNEKIVLCSYSGCGHRLFDDAPEKFYDDIVSFVKSN